MSVRSALRSCFPPGKVDGEKNHCLSNPVEGLGLVGHRSVLKVHNMTSQGRERDKLNQISAKITNFAIQYNLACASVAVLVISEVYPSKKKSWTSDWILPCVFLGAILGMFVFGRLADKIGTQPAMLAVQTVSLAGIFVSAASPEPTRADEADAFWTHFILGRSLLGLGIGGMYPVSASQSCEDEEGETETLGLVSNPDLPTTVTTVSQRDIVIQSDLKKSIEQRIRSVGWAFFYQCPGAFTPYLFALPIVLFGPSPIAEFRAILLLGSIPCVLQILCSLIFWIRFRSTGRRTVSGALNNATETTDTTENPPSLSTLPSRVWLHLLGTGGTWFLFDISYYGTAICAPFILEDLGTTTKAAFLRTASEDNSATVDTGVNGVTNTPLFPGQLGATHAIVRTCLESLCTSVLTMVSTYACIGFVAKKGLAVGHARGFLFMATTFGMLALSTSGVLWPAPGSSVPNPLVAYLNLFLFCLVTFSTGWGPNVTTYVIPTVVFPKPVRGTFHGFSAAMGKVGALIGVYLYPFLQSIDFSISSIMAIQVLFCIAGWLLTKVTIRTHPDLNV